MSITTQNHTSVKRWLTRRKKVVIRGITSRIQLRYNGYDDILECGQTARASLIWYRWDLSRRRSIVTIWGCHMCSTWAARYVCASLLERKFLTESAFVVVMSSFSKSLLSIDVCLQYLFFFLTLLTWWYHSSVSFPCSAVTVLSYSLPVSISLFPLVYIYRKFGVYDHRGR